STMNPALPAKLEEVIFKALEKDCEFRYQTAAELRGDLKRIKRSMDSSRVRASSGESGAAISQQVPAVLSAPARRSRKFTPAALGMAAVTLLAGIAIGAFLLPRPSQPSFPFYHPLTFQRGIVHSARFAPDGKTVIYSSAWEGKPLQLYNTRPESP